MKFYHKSITILTAFVMLVTPTFAKSNLELFASTYADTIISKVGAESIQYAMMEGSEIILSGTEGDYSKWDDTPLTKTHMYPIASISKMYTTASIMMLVDKAKVSLDKPITTYIPEFSMADERYQDITVRMLLNYSAGFKGNDMGNSILYSDTDTQNYDYFLQNLSTQTLKANPGEFSVYNNTGFTLAQMIVENVSGKTFSQFIYDNITEPLGLRNTKTPYDDFNHNQIAKSYSKMYKGTMNGADYPNEVLTSVGTGGIFSTAEDLCKFSRMLMRPILLSQNSLDAMQDLEYNNGIWHKDGETFMKFGLGWDNVQMYPFNEQGITVLSKNGDTYQSHSSLIVAPEYNISVAVVSSGGSSTLNLAMAGQLLLDKLIEDGHMTQPSYPPNILPTQPVALPNKFLKYEGVYADFSGVYEVSLSEDGVLLLNYAQSPEFKQKFFYQGNNIFKDEEGAIELQFIEESNGHTYIKTSSMLYTTMLPIPMTGYHMQKLEPVQVLPIIEQIWQARLGKKYYLVSEKYTSVAYTGSVIGQLDSVKSIFGYVGNLEIVDENNLVSTLQIPQYYGRDSSDIRMYQNNGIEYMISNNGIYIVEDAIKTLEHGLYQINKYGLAQWYNIPNSDVGQILNVAQEGAGMYAIYDKDNLCIFNSWIKGPEGVLIPEGAKIVFAGDVGSLFEISTSLYLK
ncbi:MAG: hypothetical protein ATN36_06295 [Epulopiscium sp. Nele67-Bin005]|nr:MAG: hypothetical protein ATN36_06295 [Epulopiscium sp. Nele67-Bin005]